MQLTPAESHYFSLNRAYDDACHELDSLTINEPDQAEVFNETIVEPLQRALKVASHYYHRHLKSVCPF